VFETVGAAHQGGLPVREHLTADAQAQNQVLVSFRVTAFQVFQKAAASRDHRQQSPAGMMIFAVCLEMILELQNTLAQDCYLHFWRTGIGFVNPICCNCLLFCVRRQSHARIDTPRLFLIFFVPHRIAQIAGAVPKRGPGRIKTRGVVLHWVSSGLCRSAFSQPSIEEIFYEPSSAP